MKNSTLEKLIAHEKSARKIGNIAEADAYKKKISDAKKTMPKPENPDVMKGVWKCSCGSSIQLNISGGGGKALGEMMLMPHRLAGHQLTKIS